MPIHDLGYRGWTGSRTPPVTRFLAITETGIALAWRNAWVRRLVLVAWLPALYFAIGFMLLEQGHRKSTGGRVGDRLPDAVSTGAIGTRECGKR